MVNHFFSYCVIQAIISCAKSRKAANYQCILYSQSLSLSLSLSLYIYIYIYMYIYKEREYRTNW